ncbi:MAG: DUF421 domain-containing protein [Firmicutes bacterium]|nr:DUF421 domain-containing protein [Bacillota bacterium]
MIGYILRAITMYFLALVIVRFMGKRALGELGLFDVVVMTGFGQILASVALDPRIPLYEGIAVLLTLGVLEYGLGYISLKDYRLARLISGRPVVMVDNGEIIRENLAREKFNLDDLLQELRKQGVRDIRDVQKGILEPCGGFSVILKEEAEPATRKDLGIQAVPNRDYLLTYEDFPRGVVFDRLAKKSPDEPSVAEPSFFIPSSQIEITEQVSKMESHLEQLLMVVRNLQAELRTIKEGTQISQPLPGSPSESAQT